MIKQHSNIEGIIVQMQKDKKKFDIPLDWLPMRVRKASTMSVDEVEPVREEVAEDGNVTDDIVMEGKDEVVGTEKESIVDDDDVDKEAEETTNNLTVQDSNDEEDKAEDQSSSAAPATVEENEDDFEMVPPLYEQARKLFLQCEVTQADDLELKWDEPDEAGLRAFLVDRMGFNPERVASGVKKLKEAQLQKSQKRMDWLVCSN
jgi:hypothetical protein